MVGGIFYFIAFLCAYIAILMLGKSRKPLPVLPWLGIGLILLLCYQVVMGGIMTILGIPVSCLSIGATNLALVIPVVVLLIKKKIPLQKYELDKWDILLALCLFLLVAWRFFKQFGLDMHTHYITVDPSVHLRDALEVMRTGRVDALFYCSLTQGVFIQALIPFIGEFLAYKVFIVLEAVMLYVSGLTFLGLTHMISSRTKISVHVGELILMYVYVLGYPTNNMVFGFEYLGTGVSLLACIITVLYLYLSDGNRLMCVMMLAALHTGLAVSYSLFIPIVFVASLLVITSIHIREGFVFKKWILTQIEIFYIPCLYAVAFSFIGMFVGASVSAGSAIGREGFMYRDIFFNIWIILLPMLVGIITSIKRKKNYIEMVFSVMLIGAIILLGAGVIIGKVSSYYFFKTAYPASLLMYVWAFIGVMRWCRESFRTMVAYLAGLAVLFLLFYVGIEDKLGEYNSYWTATKKLGTILDIYQYNDMTLDQVQDMSTKVMDLGRELYEGYNGERIVCVGCPEGLSWMGAFTDHVMDEDILYLGSYEHPYVNDLTWKSGSQEYVLVVIEYPDTTMNRKIIDYREPVYENEAGAIYIF